MGHQHAESHTLALGLLAACFIVYAAFAEVDPPHETGDNIKRGIVFGCAFFLLYCVLQLRDGHFIRPHPAWWRFVTGAFILYEIFLIFLLFQSTRDARQFLRHIDSSLGVQLGDRAYGQDCRIFTPSDPDSIMKNVKDVFLDVFVIAHTVGWFIGTLMIRDYVICWSISILFELLEYTFMHWLPNFNECWWDHLLVDILLCNAAGIYLGMLCCRWLEMKEYNWAGVRPPYTHPLGASPQEEDGENTNEKPTGGWFGRVAAPVFSLAETLIPASWVQYDWAVLASPHRFLAVVFMIFTTSVMMLNAFFLKAVLWIPPDNVLNVYRLALWYNAASIGLGEYYFFVTDPGCKKIGPRAWLGLAVVITEALIAVKHGRDMFAEPTPPVVILSWSLACVGLVVWAGVYFGLGSSSSPVSSTSLQPPASKGMKSD